MWTQRVTLYPEYADEFSLLGHFPKLNSMSWNITSSGLLVLPWHWTVLLDTCLLVILFVQVIQENITGLKILSYEAEINDTKSFWKYNATAKSQNCLCPICYLKKNKLTSLIVSKKSEYQAKAIILQIYVPNTL